jgi:hypothetical protein
MSHIMAAGQRGWTTGQARVWGRRRLSANPLVVLKRDGQIRQENLRIVIRSGQPVLAARAQAAIRAGVPFDPPPKVITVAIPVDFEKY